MRRVLLVAMLVGMTVLGGAQGPAAKTGLFRGAVEGPGKLPIPNAYVLVHLGEKPDLVVTLNPETATFSVKIEPGVYDVLIAAVGFSPIAKKIEIADGHTTTVRVQLKPDGKYNISD